MNYKQCVDRWYRYFVVKSMIETQWACCDCGLVHDMVFVSGEKGEKIGVAAMRNNPATAQRRRDKKDAIRKRNKQ